MILFRDRLVLPPPFMVTLCTIGYFTVCNFIYFHDPIISATFWSFFLLGYVIYDICHYSLHFIDTTNNKDGWFSKQQRYHNQHHFGGEEAGFGVSSALWDKILNTGFKKNKKGNWLLYNVIYSLRIVRIMSFQLFDCFRYLY